MKKRIYSNMTWMRMTCLLVGAALLMGCVEEIDNAKSRNSYNVEIKASAPAIRLDEAKQTDEALTVEWTGATDHGDDYITTYTYQVELFGSKEPPIKEYVEEGDLKRSYTHKELQDLLAGTWKQLTSTTVSVRFIITAKTEGPKLIIPEESSVTVKVRTYGPLQFLADKLYLSGTAVGDDMVEVMRSTSNNNLFVYTGDLKQGMLNLPVVYGDDDKLNAICPTTAQQEITDDVMPATIKVISEAGAWNIKEAGKYRVTIDMAAKTVMLIPAGDIIDFDKLFLAGTATSGNIELAQTLENADIFAFRGELKAGSLYLPIEFEGATTNAICPKDAGDMDIIDGNGMSFSSGTLASVAGGRYWNIPSDGVYRIVLNMDTKQITIYSPATDLKNKTATWNNTVDGINPYTADITQLWMYGAFNAFAGDGNGFTGFSDKYSLKQSLADPNIFVYKGDALPRETRPDEYTKENYTGSVRFSVWNKHNNVYAFGSTAEAKRNVKNGYITVTDNSPQALVEGQGDNRYAFFCMPAGTNFVMVNVAKRTVIFDKR